MSEEEKLQLENECLLKYSKARMIKKYIDELEESIVLSDLWCKSQEENKRLNNIIKQQDTRNSRQRIANRKILERNQDLVIENLKLNNIINKALGIANERFNYYSHYKSNNEEHLEDWENIFNVLLRRDNE